MEDNVATARAQNPQMKRLAKKSIVVGVLGVALHSFGATVDAQSRVDAEIRNLRALPPGFRSWCEQGSLILKSPSSARYRIGNATLCVGKPDGHVVCAANPEAGDRSGDRPVPPCSDVSAPGA